MSRLPDEYFAEPGPAPDEPPAGYFNDRPPELDALIDAVAAGIVVSTMPAYVDEMTLICGRQNGKTTLSEILRQARNADAVGDEIPSVLELTAYRDALRACLDADQPVRGWFGVLRELERADRALEDARWRLACKSHRWRRDPRMGGFRDEDTWWGYWRLQQVLWWLARRNDGVPGKELAVRQVFG